MILRRMEFKSLYFMTSQGSKALQTLRKIMEDYDVFIDFAREPEIEDPLFNEFWQFVKSWFASYERLQISLRTKYGLLKAKEQGKLYHKPTILHYYASWLFDKELSEVTKEDLNKAKKQLLAIIKKYWNNPGIKRTKIG